MIDLPLFIAKYLGSTFVGDTPANEGQCVGLVEKWLAANSKPHIWGNAVDLIPNAARAPYIVTFNTPLNAPKPGTIVCWDRTWGSGAGHTAIVVAANVQRLAVFEQNDPIGAGCLVATHDYGHIVGWIGW
jgi:hypothetical protein